MGVTIHFEGQLIDETAFQNLISRVTALAEAERWSTEPIESAEVTLLRVRDEKDWDYTGPVKGLRILLHEDCDPVCLEFDKDLYVQEFTKTQFAGAAYHEKVINVLKTIQPFFRELRVDDEGELWETGNLSLLQNHFDTVFTMIEQIRRENPAAQFKVKAPDGKIIDLIT